MSVTVDPIPPRSSRARRAVRLTVRVGLPLVLCAVGVGALIGCFYVPSSYGYQPDGKPRPESLIGNAHDSSRQIRLHQTSIAQALPILIDAIGMSPTMVWSTFDSRIIVNPAAHELGLRYQIKTGTWLSICGPSPDYASRVLVLTLDNAGVVTRTETISGDTANARGFRPFENGDARRLFGDDAEQMFSADRPATEPSR